MNVRARADWGTIPWQPGVYGTSYLGAPLEVWRPRERCRMLVFASLHGEEPETGFALSRALRLQVEQPAHAAVVISANPDGLIRATRGNARGVDLNRNFPARNWKPAPVTHRSTLDDPSDVLLSPGEHPGSERETEALLRLVAELAPDIVVALHAPLACIDDPNDTELGRWLSAKTSLPLVSGVGYATPGSFGSWAADNALSVVTYEFPLANVDTLVREHVPALAELLAS